MTKGKRICGVLKTIRKQVADANEIKYEPRECNHQGECRGTCPACEAEVRYIEQQLNIRRQLGKAVAIVGISAGLSALTGCGVKAKKADSISDEKSKLTDGKMMVEKVETVDGDVEYRSPVDTVIVEKDMATIKKRTAPFQTPAPQHEEEDMAGYDEVIGSTGVVEVEPVPIPNPGYLAPDTTKVYDVVEQMPSFPGGQQKLMEYLSENTHYPKECKEIGVQGRVIVSFVVERDGSISGVKIIRCLDPLMDVEAGRVISSMPKWNPGRQDGVAVRVKYILPVNFRL